MQKHLTPAKAMPNNDATQFPSGRMAKESAKAYDAFRKYCELGPMRTLRDVAQECNKHVSQMGRWSSAHHWQKRLETWQAEQDAIQLDANRQAARERAKTMQDRRQKMEDEAFDIYTSLTAKIRAMLNWPLARRTVHGSNQDNDMTVTYEPVGWRLTDVARLGQFRELMRRLSLGEPVSPQEIRALEHATVAVSNNVPTNNTSGAPSCVITIEGALSEEDEMIYLPKTAVP